ncbi:family 10 glycosylhydrolase [Parabacteroides sp. OttesenSCG-928-G06]|nr:family 10 glycosylhydrolase [Parabacteroides sp. OttesenSCG-928-K15]MDL2282172.1 family 10 glycosylhydrolase [Parabacteroides sp. OttesenSCG-928-G06]
MRRIGALFIYFLITLSVWAAKPPRTEVRAVWLTTIYGLDWPSEPATTPAGIKRQQEELIHILDRLEEANFNTVFVQSRQRGDVIYRSAVEPFAKVFSGKYGVSPGYDPLVFIIDECHKRGMECHAWFVTYPVGNEKTVKEQGARSVVKRYPKLVKRHRGEWYLDPGIPGTTDYISSLVRELVSAYNIDGIHFDYIRYPEQAQTFPDKATHAAYGKGEPLAVWRRNNINRMVSRIYDEVKAIKPWVQVSSSPLGKYNRIEQVPNAGWTAYESVFQDPQQWMETGKHDMIVPMMYYLHDNFFPFVDNWAEICNGRLVVPGLGAYRTEANEADWAQTDITDQIDYGRYYGASGSAFFRCRNILDDTKGLYSEIKDNYYKHPALLPPLTWLDDRVPASPGEVGVERKEKQLRIHWQQPEGEEDELTYTLYYSLTDTLDRNNAMHILATGIRSTEVYLPIDPEVERGYLFQVTASTRFHIESPPSPETYYFQSAFLK